MIRGIDGKEELENKRSEKMWKCGKGREYW